MKAAMLVLMVLLLPATYAFPCRDMPITEWVMCQALHKLPMPQDEIDLLVSTMLYSDSIPNHEIIKEWNLGINPTRPPHDTITKNSGYIKDAWLEIIGVYPSVEFNNSILSPKKGELHTEYNYEIKYPKTSGCNDKYKTLDKNEQLSISANDIYQGDKKLQKYYIIDDADLKAELDIELKTEVSHYNRKKGKCTFTGSDIKTDKIKLSDRIAVKLDSTRPTIDFKVIDFYRGTRKASIEGSNYSALIFSTQLSSAAHYNFDYSLGWKFKPYYAIYLKADKHEHYETKNIVINKIDNIINYHFPDSRKCNIISYSHFAKFDVPCSISTPVSLALKTDKLKYNEGDSIIVSTSPQSEPVKISYGKISKISDGKAVFKAEQDYGMITAEFQGQSVSKSVEVSDTRSWQFFWKLVIVCIFALLLYKILSKYLGGMIS